MTAGSAALDPERLRQQFESSLEESYRRSRGVYYTPADIADGLVRVATTHLTVPPQEVSICDPAVGGGAFLLAAARWLESCGIPRRQIVERHLWGADVDPAALELAARSLSNWARRTGREAPDPMPNLVCADFLIDGPERLAAAGAPPSFDLVVGNPPFLGQLRRRTARGQDQAARIRSRFGTQIGPYTDAAALFLLAGIRVAGPGGVLALLLPHSVLSARDSAGVRATLESEADLVHIWYSDEKLFEGASARVCAPVLRRRAKFGSSLGRERHRREGRTRSRVVSRSVGSTFTAAPEVRLEASGGAPGESASGATPATRTWWALVADLAGVPEVSISSERTLGHWCTATAGFRQQFYGLAPFVEDRLEGDEQLWPKLVTSGLIDPGTCLWSLRPARFARRTYRAPRLDIESLARSDPSLGDWVAQRMVPKVVVATQTRIIEAAVDVRGCWVPSTPTVSMEPRDPRRIWEVAAVLLAPPVSAWAMARFGGAALGPDHLKLSARQLLEVPLPSDAIALARAVDILRGISGENGGCRIHLLAAARALCEAYGVGDEVLDWWSQRLPSRIT